MECRCSLIRRLSRFSLSVCHRKKRTGNWWNDRKNDKMVKTLLWEILDYFCSLVRIHTQKGTREISPVLAAGEHILRVQPVVLVVWSSFSNAGREPLWVTGRFTVFTSQSMLWWSVCSKSMSQWWVTLCLCECVLPQRRFCYLLLQWPCCYASLSCGTTLLRSLTQLILLFFFSSMHSNTVAHRHTCIHKTWRQTHTVAHILKYPTFCYINWILPVGCEGGLVTWLYALPASAREIIVMHSRLVIFSLFFHTKRPLQWKYKYKTWKEKTAYLSFKYFRRAKWTKLPSFIIFINLAAPLSVCLCAAAACGATGKFGLLSGPDKCLLL